MGANKTTKTFNGKLYRLFDFCFGSAEAKSEAVGLRKEGWLIRVVPAGSGYHIWRRRR